MVSTVRSATSTDVAAIATTLSRAFLDDPTMVWLWPDLSARRRGMSLLFRAMTRHQHLPGGGVEVAELADGTLAGAALWDPPGGWSTPTLRGLLMTPLIVRAFGRRLVVGRTFIATLERAHPTAPHWYLGTIGTDPSMRGGGHGRALLASRLERCDAERSPAYLESSKVENVGYYERFGFRTTGEIVVPDGGPTLYPMWREPQ